MSGRFSPTPAESPIDDLYWRESYEPITESDDELRDIVDNTDLVPLLIAVAAATNDASILRDETIPPQPPADIAPAPQGGLNEGQQEAVREDALAALRKIRDEGITTIGPISRELAAAIFRWTTGGRGPEFNEMLFHEMPLVEGASGKPTWNYDDVRDGKEFSVAVIGGGVAGISAAYRLKQAGIPFTVFEKGGRPGGTWWKNTYPGVRLDTPNYAYSFSFAQKDDWPQQFSKGDEIQNYMDEVAERGGILENFEFNTEVSSLTWDEDANLWNLRIVDSTGATTDRTFNAVMTGVGQLDRPKFPDTPGRETFAGIQVHSAEWQPGIELAGKRVAVVGTGASAYQIVPAIVDEVSSLTVFQRSSPWMLPTRGYYADMPDSVQWLVKKVPYYGQWLRFWQYWLGVEGRQHTTQADPNWKGENSISEVNQKVQDELLALLKVQYEDRPDLLEKVTPRYILGGKRMLRDNGVWAESLKKPHVKLVTEGMESMEPAGVRTADGELHELDVIIYATGFQASEFLEPLVITGEGGVDLHDHWGGDAKAYLGLSVPGFPNFFILSGPNTGHVVNGSLFTMIEGGVEYTIEVIRQMLEKDIAAVDLKPEVLEEYQAKLDAASAQKAWGHPSVRTWYKNKFGRVSQIWPFPVLDFWDMITDVDLDKYELTSAE